MCLMLKVTLSSVVHAETLRNQPRFQLLQALTRQGNSSGGLMAFVCGRFRLEKHCMYIMNVYPYRYALGF